MDYEYLKRLQNETVAKEISLVAADVTQIFHFESPYVMMLHGSEEKGPDLDDGHTTYKLFTAVSEAVAGFAHLYSYGASKCKFLSELLGRPILNLQDFKCPTTNELKTKYSCSLSCHIFHNVS
jgi:hypothetical protein